VGDSRHATRKCISNAPEVVAATPKAERTTELQISEGQEPVVKTLGVSWNSLGDTFTITTAKVSAELHLIKQNVLRKIATIFESQDSSSKVWSRGFDWEDVTPENVWVPRCFREPKEVINKRITTLQAYGTVVYLQCVYDDGVVTSRLIASKSKVAPLNDCAPSGTHGSRAGPETGTACDTHPQGTNSSGDTLFS